MSKKLIGVVHARRTLQPPVCFNQGGVPAALKERERWICWIYTRDRSSPKGFRKTPIDIRSGKPANATDPSIWCSFSQAFEFHERSQAKKDASTAGLGYALGDDDPVVVVDIDHCIIDVGGKPCFTPEAKQIIKDLDTYTEVSPSGEGVKCYCIAEKPGAGCKRGDGPIEMYSNKRFVAVTGVPVGSSNLKIRKRQQVIDDLYKEHVARPEPKRRPDSTMSSDRKSHLSDEEVLHQAISNEKAGDRFRSMFEDGEGDYTSGSELDMALANALAFWCNGDPAQIERLMRRSALVRDKWDTHATYLERTIAKAVEGRTEFYCPNYEPATDVDVQCLKAPLSDMGNARRFVHREGANFQYTHSVDVIRAWNEDHWEIDNGGIQAKQAAKRVVRAMKRELRLIPKEDAGRLERFRSFMTKSQSRKALDNMLELSKSEPEIAVSPNEWDPNPWRINLLNGTFDLKTARLLRHQREDRITTVTRFVFDPDAKCPRWNALLREIFEDPELRLYFRRICGYCLTGDTSEECFFLFWGTGRNGKSTILDVLAMILAGYHVKGRPETFVEKRDTENVNHLAQIARLAGKRLVTISETREGARLNEELIKEFTGRDTVTARGMYQAFFEFVPQGKIIIGTNSKPEIAGANLGIWRRVRMVPFTVTIPEERVDRGLREKLKSELPGILNWAIRGFSDWQEHGLNEPEIVRQATAQYRDDEDRVGLWLTDRVKDSPGHRESASDLFQDHLDWLTERNERHKPSQKHFGEQLKAHGLKSTKSGTMVYRDVALKSLNVEDYERRAGIK